VKSATTAASNWSGSAARAQTAFVAGVQATTKDQAALAVAAQARLVQGFNDAVNSGRWARGVQRGGTGYWKSQTEAKAANFGTGFSAGAGNFAAAITKILAAENSIVSSLPARGDINANLQRANAFALGMHQLKGTLGARS
jgi:hypothetical protein